jgi:hypothetical protein
MLLNTLCAAHFSQRVVSQRPDEWFFENDDASISITRLYSTLQRRHQSPGSSASAHTSVRMPLAIEKQT